MSCILVSWINTSTGSFVAISFLSELLLGLAVSPRMFHEIIDVMRSDFDEMEPLGSATVGLPIELLILEYHCNSFSQLLF